MGNCALPSATPWFHFPQSLFALDCVAFSSTRHCSQPPDNHKRPGSKNYIKDFFNWTSALTGVTVQLFARSAWQSTWERLPSAGETAQSQAFLAPAASSTPLSWAGGREIMLPAVQHAGSKPVPRRAGRRHARPRARGPLVLEHGQTEEHLCWGDMEQISNCCFY